MMTVWLLERDTACTSRGVRHLLFRVWPGPEATAVAKVRGDSLPGEN